VISDETQRAQGRAPLDDPIESVSASQSGRQGGSPASRLEGRSGSDDAPEALNLWRLGNLVSRAAPVWLLALMAARSRSWSQSPIEKGNLTLHQSCLQLKYNQNRVRGNDERFDGRRRFGPDGAMEANFANRFWNTSRLFDAYSTKGGAVSTMALKRGHRSRLSIRPVANSILILANPPAIEEAKTDDNR
jgi:hypothetical protein